MDKRVKQSLWILLAVVIIYPIVISLTMSLSSNGKGLLHFVMALVFAGMLFNTWSSFKNATTKQIIGSILVVVGFIVALPLGIEIAAFMPIWIKGAAHFVLVFLFIGLFIWVWKDESKAPDSKR